MVTFIIFILVLSILILVHEFGHFLAARISNIKVEEFGLGIPPRVVTVWKDHETRYTLNLLPIGGFVKLHGENIQGLDETNSLDKSRSFYHKNNLIKTFVLLAGVSMNLLLGYVLMIVVVANLGIPSVENTLSISAITTTSPALNTELKTEDMISAYRSSESNQEFTPINGIDNFIAFINQNIGNEVELQVIQNPETTTPNRISINLTPRTNPPAGEGPLGVGIAEVPYVTYQKISWWQIPYRALIEVGSLVVLMFTSLSQIVVDLTTKGIIPQDLAGPLGIAKITGEVAKQGLIPLIQFTAFISINLAVVNVLPFPALDGGRFLFVLIESVTRKKINPKYETWIHAGGMIVLLILVALISIYDFQRFF